jgi:micrococcal nuclease
LLRLGVLVAVAAIVVKLLEDRQSAQPLRNVEPPRPPRPTPATVAWVEPQGTVCPTSHPIKAKLASKVFRKPDARGYDTSKPDRCYASEDAARHDGFHEAQR